MPRYKIQSLSHLAVLLAAIGLAAPVGATDVDVENIVTREAVPGSDIPVDLHLIRTWDGLYTAAGIRRPAGDGRFPIVLFASGNGGGGMPWVRIATENQSWTQEQFLAAGYAVAWLRYRAEVELGYNKGGKFVEDIRQGRQLLNRSPLEYEDEIAIIDYVKTLPYVDPARVGILGLSHGGEMALKITSEYQGVAAAVAHEPAAHEFLALRPDSTVTVNEATHLRNLEHMQMAEVAKVRARIDMAVAGPRIAGIATPFLVVGRNQDHLQGIFRATYELLVEAGKDVTWLSYEHPEHGFIYPARGPDGAYHPDDVQRQAVADAIAFFNAKMGPTSQ